MSVNNTSVDSKRAAVNSSVMLSEAVMCMKNGEFGVACATLDQMIARDSSDWRPFVNRSYCRQQLSALLDSLSDANKAVALKPNVNSYYRKGCVLLALRQFRAAENCLISALKCSLSDKPSKWLLADIRRQFCHELGFTDHSLALKYDSCSSLADAIIDGTLAPQSGADTTDNTNGGETYNSLSGGDIAINELSIYCDLFLNDDLSDDSNGWNDTNGHSTKVCFHIKGVRPPKTNPFAKKNTSADMDGTIQLKNASFVSLASSSDLSSSETNIDAKLNDSDTTPTKKFVSTRPKFVRRVNLDD